MCHHLYRVLVTRVVITVSSLCATQLVIKMKTVTVTFLAVSAASLHLTRHSKFHLDPVRKCFLNFEAI